MSSISAPLGADAPHAYAPAIRRYRFVGLMLIGAFAAGLVGWTVFAPLSSAVIAGGRLEVAGSIKKVQHETGGTIAEIRVSEGSVVKAGDVLIRLDATSAQASLDIVQGKLDELWLAAARLRAERDGQASFTLPEALVERAGDPDVIGLLKAEQRLFTVRRDARDGEKGQLSARIDQYNSQIDGLATQKTAKETEIRLTTSELNNARDLNAKGVATQARVNDLESALAQLQGEYGQIEAQIAELGGRIAETRLQTLNIDQTAIADAGRDLKDTESQIGEMQQRRLAAADQLDRMQIRAPINGVVHQLQVHTVGGVAGAGEVLLTIVPSDGPLDIEARLSPADIEAVHVGEPATIRFPGLNHATTPELQATVKVVGADLTEDPVTRQSYYPVTLDLDPGQAERLGDVALVPGMPVETFIASGKRTLLDYMMEPIRDRMAHAMREQ